MQATQLGKYRLLRRIGVGGMAEVFEAELEAGAGCAKRLAVKLLLPDSQREPELVRAFIDEAQLAAGLHHPNIVEVYDFGQGDGGYFLAMELVDGWDLREILRRLAARGSRMPPEAAAYVVHEVALALHYIHTRERAIVHRDVSPHNVFLTREGQLKLGDFGVAKTSARLARTVSGQIKGKLAYLSPEQVSGDPVSGRTDVYAAGLVLFELLTGRRYIQGEHELELLRAAQSPPRIRPSSLASEAAPLDATVLAALEPHPAMRTRDAALLGEQLRSFLAGHPYGAQELAALAAELDGNRIPSEARPEPEAPAISPGRQRGTLELPEVPEERPRTRGRWPKRWKLITGAAIASALIAWGVLLALRPGLFSRAAPAAVAAVTRSDATPPAPTPVDAEVTDPFDAQAATSREQGTSVDHGRRRASGPAKTHRVRVRAVAIAPTPKEAPRPSPTPKPSGEGRPAPALDAATREAARLKLAELGERARAKGLFPGDDPTHDRARTRAQSVLVRGVGVEAAFRELANTVDGFRIEQAFIKRKLGRLEAVLARPGLAEAERQRLTLASQRILKLVLGGQLVEASRRISAALGVR